MKKIILVSTLLSLGANGVFAQSSGFKPGFYAGAEFGYASVKDESSDIASSLRSVLGGTATASQSTSLYDGRAFVGYKIIEHVDLEVGYSQSSNVNFNASGSTSGGNAYSVSGDVSMSGVDYSLLLRPSISSGFNKLFLRAGGTYLTQKININASANGNRASGTTNTSGSGYLLGLGYDLPISKDIDVRAAYTYVGNIAGESNNYSNRFSIGILGKF
jgi:hypothetical protein